jgi:uncharacterized delta-60 repeat protein
MRPILFLLLFAPCAAIAQSSCLDSTFGVNGTVIKQMGALSGGYFYSLAIQADHKIIAAGVADSILVIRYNPNGSVDSSFGADGAYNGPAHSIANAIALQPDGKITGCGTITVSGVGGLAFRLKTNGSPDSTFGNNGMVNTSFASPYNIECNALALQPDGKIILAGSANATSMGFARLLPNGRFDSPFGINGMVVTELWSTWAWGRARSVAVLPDGRIVAAGGTASGEILVVRMNANGSPDTTFNHTGVVITSAGFYFTYCHSMLLMADGKVVVSGAGVFGPAGYDFMLIRYLTNGNLDRSYGDTGIAHIDINGQYDEVYATCKAPGGKILAAGYTTTNNRENFALACIDSNGKADSSFGNYGRIVTPIQDSNDRAYAIALQADGKVVTAGASFHYYGWGYEHDPTLARYFSGLPSGVERMAKTSTTPLLYPNPARKVLYIDGKTGAHIVSISATDMTGRSVPINADIANGKVLTGNLQPGMYVFSICFDDRPPVTEKIVMSNR